MWRLRDRSHGDVWKARGKLIHWMGGNRAGNNWALTRSAKEEARVELWERGPQMGFVLVSKKEQKVVS